MKGHDGSAANGPRGRDGWHCKYRVPSSGQRQAQGPGTDTCGRAVPSTSARTSSPVERCSHPMAPNCSNRASPAVCHLASTDSVIVWKRYRGPLGGSRPSRPRIGPAAISDAGACRGATASERLARSPETRHYEGAPWLRGALQRLQGWAAADWAAAGLGATGVSTGDLTGPEPSVLGSIGRDPWVTDDGSPDHDVPAPAACHGW